jgi:uncharacterized protein with GYD domain
MPKYLVVASYSPEGANGLYQGGGTARRAVVEKMLEDLGGRLEAFYFAFGEDDAYLTLDVPDNTTAAARVASSGRCQRHQSNDRGRRKRLKM